MADTKIYLRTEDGVLTEVSVKDALAEVNEAMLGRVDRARTTRTISSSYGHHHIVYRDGRNVLLVLTDAPKPAGTVERDNLKRRIVTVKGKRYIVTPVIPARPRTPGAKCWTPEAYAHYWTERNGETFGATRSACASQKPGTVGRTIWDALSAYEAQ